MVDACSEVNELLFRRALPDQIKLVMVRNMLDSAIQDSIWT
jgi:hypothetical protein